MISAMLQRRCLTTAICECCGGISSFLSAFSFSRVSMFEDLLFQVGVTSDVQHLWLDALNCS